MNDVIERIPLGLIQPHPSNRRVGGFDQAKLEQLADSIRAVGVQQPAVVRLLEPPGPDSAPVYELVAGERRWRASEIAGMDFLPCVVRKLDDAAALRIQIIENLQREDVHPLDEADGYARLIEEGGYEVDIVAQELGKSASYVYQRLKLLDLVLPVRALLVSGKISAGHAILIARLAPEQQHEVRDEIDMGTGQDWEAPSVRELASWIQDNIMMELSRASWKLDDAKLLPEVGSCKACSKRTGFQPALFADVSKKDHCTDRACFQAKGQALVEKKRSELKKVEHLEVVDGYVPYGTKPEGALVAYDWIECKKKDPGALPVLIVAGTQPGRLTYGIKRETGRSQYTPSEEQQAGEKSRKARAKARDEARKAIFEELIEQLELEIAREGRLSLQVLRPIVAMVWERTWDEGQRSTAVWMKWGKPAKPHGWRTQGLEKIEAMDEASLLRFLAVCAFCEGLTKAGEWSTVAVPSRLTQAAQLYGIDSAEVLAAAYEKHGVSADEEIEDEDGSDEEEAAEEEA